MFLSLDDGEGETEDKGAGVRFILPVEGDGLLGEGAFATPSSRGEGAGDGLNFLASSM